MNLKTLISIKFIFSSVTFFCSLYLVGNLTDSYKKLENQNRILLKQKEQYEEIIKLEQKNVNVNSTLYNKIKAENSILLKSEKSNLSIQTNIWILIGFLIIIFNVFSFLNTKIEKLKSEETELEKEMML